MEPKNFPFTVTGYPFDLSTCGSLAFQLSVNSSVVVTVSADGRNIRATFARMDEFTLDGIARVFFSRIGIVPKMEVTSEGQVTEVSLQYEGCVGIARIINTEPTSADYITLVANAINDLRRNLQVVPKS